MSRIGSQPVEITSGIEFNISGNEITVKGSKGTLSQIIPDGVSVKREENQVVVSPANDSDESRARWGLVRSLIFNMVKGVSEGFTKNLEINGVGYRAAVQGKILKLALGYSHDIDFPIPEGIEIKCAKPTEVEISGFDKQKVGQVAAEIRAFRKPEPYKGKGIKYSDEHILRKEGKKK